MHNLFSKHYKKISLLAKAGLMAIAFWVALRGLDMAQLRAMLATQSEYALVAGGAMILVQAIFGAARWRYIMAVVAAGANAPIVSLLHAIKYFYISIFFNCCLPGTVGGDVVRVWLIKSEHTPLPLAISSVVIDRLMALFALGVMGFATMPILAGYIGISAWVAMPICAALGAGGLWLLFNLDSLPFLRSAAWLSHLLHNLRLLLVNKKLALVSLFYAILGHSCYSLFVYIIAQSLGSPLSLVDSLTLAPWVLLAAIIPLSIGGWGLREAAMVFMLALVSVPQEAALAISVQLGILSIITSLPAGILWLLNRKHEEQQRPKTPPTIP